MKKYFFVLIIAVSLLLAACVSGPSGLRVSGSRSKFVGNVWPDAKGDGIFMSEYWDQITPSNAGKWESVEGQRDQMYWGSLDTAYKLAKSQRIPFRLHTLVWGLQQPYWIEGLSETEQREEVEEWMKLAGHRYPKVDFVDVVNEPLHETPVYYKALGGAGESGYEWVLNSFRLARKYFPNAKLHLNDYNILKSFNKTREYAALIKLLQNENLIDGIGLQAHFLDDTQAVTVKGNLNLLAKTGLPIYITELDIDIADDMQQARQFRDLFTVFYEHPQVEGITLWGALEGRMWNKRKDAYIIRHNGEYRMAMEWLDNYLHGDKSYEIPELAAEHKTDNNATNRIEAEFFDEGRGVKADNNVLAFIDGTDWVKYSSVNFSPEYNSVKIRYSKGRGSASKMQLSLGELRGDVLLTAEFENTGSWSEFKEIILDLPQTEGVYDVYLRFVGAKNVANIDYIEFIKNGSDS